MTQPSPEESSTLPCWMLGRPSLPQLCRRGFLWSGLRRQPSEVGKRGGRRLGLCGEGVTKRHHGEKISLMRTTGDLPDDLLLRAHAAAEERGVTLQEPLRSALAKELATPPEAGRRPGRVRLPIFESDRPGNLNLTNADLAEAEAEEDRRGSGLAR